MFFIILNADYIKKDRWAKDESFLQFLERNSLPLKLYYDLDPEEKENVSELYAGVKYLTLFDENSSIKQLLIPINEELQIHIFKKKDGYGIKLIPVEYDKKLEKLVMEIEYAPYNDILKKTNNVRLAHEFINAFKSSVDFSHSIKKGDRLVIIYEQKYRLGEIFGMPDIKVAMIETNGRKNYVFNYKGRFYDERGRELETFFLTKPINRARITSRFSLRRWHPILHRYIAHLGVDFGARRGTPIKAAGGGVVVFAGRKGGYGKTVIIAHGDGYRTLYAHMSRFRKGIRRGKRVKKGQIIGYVGSTGLSTGPHLHFGLYRHRRPINPLRVVKITKKRLWGKRLKEFKKMTKEYKNEIDKLLKGSESIKRIEDIDLITFLGEEDGEKRAN
jgi:murein DD-endopeptidase MepM/ murein hydrolase activator NlpD